MCICFVSFVSLGIGLEGAGLGLGLGFGTAGLDYKTDTNTNLSKHCSIQRPITALRRTLQYITAITNRICSNFYCLPVSKTA